MTQRLSQIALFALLLLMISNPSAQEQIVEMDERAYAGVVYALKSSGALSINNQPIYLRLSLSSFYVEDINKWIASIQGRDLDIMRAVLASLPPQQRSNVIFRAPDGGTYTNPEGLKGTIVPINTNGMINLQSDVSGQAPSVPSGSVPESTFSPPLRIEPLQVTGDDAGGYPQGIDHILQETGGPTGQCKVDNAGVEGAGGAFWMGARR